MTLSFDPAALALPHGHYIGGRYRAAEGGLALRRPSDGRAFADCPVADATVVDEAVQTARAALKASGWADVRPRDRVNVLHRWAALVEQHAARLARLEAVASTRPVGQAVTADVAVSAEQIRFFAELADKEGGDVVPTASDHLGMILTEPYGVVGAITPWNFPLSIAVWKLAPALAAGNAVVLKPSEMTPFATLHLVELAEQAGVPAGVVNVVLGDGPTTGNAITGHPDIAKISFTGSTAAGQAIMANVSRGGVKPMTLELGGKSPQIVFADADLALAADCIARGITYNAGQVCVAGSRLLVERSVAPALTEALSRAMAHAKPQATWDEAATYSPIISERQLNRIESIVAAAVAQGAEVIVGGRRFDGDGYYFQPTVLTGVTETSPAVTEEIFGPVLTVQIFDSEEEALALANHPTYGLASGLFTRDLSRALRITKQIEAGTVWVNRYGRSRDHILPTGGYRNSGVGKDLGREAYKANRRQKSVLIAL
ncbi:aldehyde dehydrogenase family protein [Pseudochelatococcus lubricantis]|uniref:aldehyde dehydrogenase family protein n=1 Tax=Pseudochelatococcus lubricantis TaxID=1538102 RepID=UPI0035E8B8DB